MIKRTILLIVLVALVAAACTSGGDAEPSPSTGTGPTGSGPTGPSATGSLPPPSEVGALPASLVSFAEFVDVPLLGDDAPAYAGPATAGSLGVNA